MFSLRLFTIQTAVSRSVKCSQTLYVFHRDDVAMRLQLQTENTMPKALAITDAGHDSYQPKSQKSEFKSKNKLS